MAQVSIALILVLFFTTPAAAITQVVQGSGAQLVTTQSTGIYVIAHLERDGRISQSIALFRKGQMTEIHTRVVGGPYLNRKAGSTAIRVPTAKFDQLITAAGGLNVNVEQLPAAKRNQFYQLAGFVPTPATPPRPPEVAPDPAGHCPQGYEFRPFPGGGKPGSGKCMLITEAPPAVRSRFVTWWQGWTLVPTAEAVVHELAFQLSHLFGDVTFHFDDQSKVYTFTGFGFSIIWDDAPAG
jgi:hypothetical protein